MIYTNAFILSLLGLAAAGRNLRTQQKLNSYIGYVGKFQKSINSTDEFEERLGQYTQNDDFIEECNYNAEHTDENDPVFCGHNEMSDWTDAEYNAILGFTGGDEDSEDEDDDSFSDDEMPDMLGIALATTVDHTPLMTPVKSQGGCGSCWAFAATSALEGTIGVNTGVISERLSEQQGVDCTRNTEANEKIFGEHYGCWGCSGCWMAPHWRFMRDHGVMTNEDYTYTAKNEDCKHDNNKIKGKTKEWGIAGKKDVKAMKAKVMQQPGAVALHASSKQFQFYKSGTLKQCCDASNANCNEDTVSINHAVTIVGYTEKNDKDKKVEKCTVKDWWIECTTEEGEGGEDHTDADGDSNYWKIQNSWGKNWGNNGFIKMEISDGEGVCRINKHGVHWVDFDYDTIPARR